MSKMTEQELFEHYIVSPKRHLREKRYLIQWLTFLILFIAWELYVYSDWSALITRVGGIPLFNFQVWFIILAHYLYMTIYMGSKTLDLDAEQELGLIEQ